MLWKDRQGVPVPEQYLLDKVRPPALSAAMVRGGILGQYVEGRLSNPGVDHETAWRHALYGRMLELVQVGRPDEVKSWEDEAKIFWKRWEVVLSQMLLNEESFEIQTERSFLLPWLGIRGRLDVWVRRPNQWDVIEIKAKMRPPLGDYIVPEHALQVYVYQLMLSTLQDRPDAIHAYVAYLSDANRPLRKMDVSSAKWLHDLMRIRNHAVGYEFWLAFRGISLVHALRAKSRAFAKERVHQWLWRDYHQMLQRVDNLTSTESCYFSELHAFLAREQWYTLIGTTHISDQGRRGYASLWRPTTVDDPFQRITGLALEESDVKKDGRLVFRHDSAAYFAGREGDVVILMPQNALWERQFRALPLYTGTILQRSADHITVAFRDRSVVQWVEQQSTDWTLVLETYIAGYPRMVAALARLPDAPPDQRSLLMGITAPDVAISVSPIRREEFAELTDRQFQLLQKIVASPDYFLLQGPPGTGKTRYMLRHIVQAAVRKGQKVLLVGYTNRSVDEMCGAIADCSVRVLRLGSVESTEFPELTIEAWQKGEGFDLTYWRRRMENLDCIAGTVHAVMRIARLEKLFPYDRLVIDEASQVLDSYGIGLLTTRRAAFVMIGDERQLPAVTVQSEADAAVGHEALRQLGFSAWNESTFGRLLRRCQSAGWDHAHGMLVEQGRMHTEIQEVASQLFYEGRLRPIDPQRQNASLRHVGLNVPVEIAARRVVFIDVPSTGRAKENPAEVRCVIKAVEWLLEMQISESEIGIIAPFRAQVAAIQRQLRSLRKGYRILVDTVERFQGGERRAMIISLAVAHPDMLPMIASRPLTMPMLDRKLNVMLTRAKEYLIIIGNRAVLIRDPVYASMLNMVTLLRC